MNLEQAEKDVEQLLGYKHNGVAKYILALVKQKDDAVHALNVLQETIVKKIGDLTLLSEHIKKLEAENKELQRLIILHASEAQGYKQQYAKYAEEKGDVDLARSIMESFS